MKNTNADPGSCYWNSTFAIKTKKQLDGGVVEKKPINTKPRYGLSGKGRSKEHVEFHTKVIATGCFACNYLKEPLLIPHNRLCIHHPRGRNKGKANDISEWFVICLCHAHHDPSTMNIGSVKNIPSVHGNKKSFIVQIGNEAWCVHETYRVLGIRPVWFTESRWQAYLSLADKETQTIWLQQAGDVNGLGEIHPQDLNRAVDALSIQP